MPILALLLTFLISSTLFAIDDKQDLMKDSIVIKEIRIKGNHRTKDKIIIRELEFSTDSQLAKQDFETTLKKSQENLINTSLFNFVEISNVPEPLDSSVIITINLIERWFILPYASIRSAEENINTWWLYKNPNHLSLAMTVVDFNSRGRREQLVVKTNIGFDRSFGISYTMPYINRAKTWGLQVNASYGIYKEMIIGVEDLEYQFFRDLDSPVLQNVSYGIGAIWRPYFRTTQQFNIDFVNAQFSDKVLEKNPQIIHNQNAKYLVLTSKLKIDNRNNRIYPTEGSYADLIFIQKGLNILPNEKSMLTKIEINARFFQKLHTQLYWASGVQAFISRQSSKTQYFGEELGNYMHELRAYEHYRIPMDEAIICKNNLKFELLPKTIKKVPFVKSESIGKIHYAMYVNAFIDGAFIKPNQQRNVLKQRKELKSNFLYSSGVGLDFVTYYDMVFRFECSRNFEFNEWGFFVHLRTSI
jgi:outer membrane protein assembly factor BamA